MCKPWTFIQQSGSFLDMGENSKMFLPSRRRSIPFLISVVGMYLGGGIFVSSPAFSEKVINTNQLAPPVLKIASENNKEVILKAHIPLAPGLHLYGPKVEKPFFATKVSIKEQGPIIWEVSPQYPEAKKMDVLGQSIEFLQPDEKTNEVTITVKGKVLPQTPSGKYEIKVNVTYQACSETQCLPPVVNKTLSTYYIVGAGLPTIKIGGIEQNTVSSQKAPEQGYGTSFSFFNYHIDLKKTGVWVPLIIAFIAGVILNIMPCVLPVIPIKILQLTKQAQQEHHSPTKLSLVFGLGVIFFFLSIGIMAVVLKSSFSWGQSFQSPAVIISLCLVLILLALGMFDIYQVTVPSFIANRDIVQKGYLGALSMGFLAGILSTPCSFGLLGAAVAWAQMQIPLVTLLAFLSIGLGMACPYFVLSKFPSLLNKIPHTGRWTEIFKEAMGFVLFGVVAFLVSALPKDRILSTLMYFVLFSFIIWFWGVVLEFKIGKWVKAGRGLVLISLILTGWSLLKPNDDSIVWDKLDRTSFREVMSRNKPVVLEFTADWCLNCRTVEYLVYQNKTVKKFLQKNQISLLKGDLTETNEYATELLKSLSGQSGIPFTIIIKPDGKKVLLPGIFNSEEFLKGFQK
jgi:thiol:disulfide interchange protein DsbD